MVSQRFCVLTSGRTGSTALMERFREEMDVVLPSHDVDCVDEELLHPERAADYARHYAEATGRAIQDESGLVDAFFGHHADAAYVGFKSMPNRHPNLAAFVSRPDVAFITLTRADIPSTVASFMLAMRRGTWRRHGGQPQQSWTFTEADEQQVRWNLAYVLKANATLARVPARVRLTYENLFAPGFRSAELDKLFGRPIQIAAPKAPVSGRDYVTNWQVFTAYLNRTVQEMMATRACGPDGTVGRSEPLDRR